MINWEMVSKWFVLIWFLVLVGYDIFVFNVAGQKATVTRVIDNFCHEYPIMVLAIGIILGHIFWQLDKGP